MINDEHFNKSLLLIEAAAAAAVRVCCIRSLVTCIVVESLSKTVVEEGDLKFLFGTDFCSKLMNDSS